MWYNTIGKILGIIAVYLTLILILMLLWNWLMPYLFNLPTINFWQACGIDIFITILFMPNLNIKLNNNDDETF